MIEGGWIIVLITASKRSEAEKIARRIVEDKLGACVNIVDNVKSIYWWRGSVEEADETLLIVKTRVKKFEELVEKVKSMHSYEVPEIIAIPIVMGYAKYMKWLDETIR